ncbi:uncharacterized protein LOC112466362, partial [Temnothorax curvispinosus]|uniref:Uncharacterized protein LOC112466362 n=1 Tax=Temnothorax curvispinosus TaxID=300111 RepID=A0A6J1R7K8_9HYME
MTFPFPLAPCTSRTWRPRNGSAPERVVTTHLIDRGGQSEKWTRKTEGIGSGTSAVATHLIDRDGHEMDRLRTSGVATYLSEDSDAGSVASRELTIVTIREDSLRGGGDLGEASGASGTTLR